MTLVWCGAAQAAVTVDGGGSTVTVTGDTAENDVVFGTANADGTEVHVYISTTTPVQSGGVGRAVRLVQRDLRHLLPRLVAQPGDRESG